MTDRTEIEEDVASPSTAARALGGAGVLALVVVFLLGPSEKGFSLSTGLSVGAVLALAAAGILAREAFFGAWRQKGAAGRPFAAAFVVLLLFAVARLGIVATAEAENAAVWAELEEALVAEGPNPDRPLYAAWRRAPNDEMKVRIVARLGEVGRGRAGQFLLDRVFDRDESREVRETAAASLAKIATPRLRDPLLDQLRRGGEFDRAQARRVLAAMVGEDLGVEAEAWHERFLAEDLAEGSDRALDRFLDRLLASRTKVYSRHRDELVQRARPEWRDRLQQELGREVPATYHTDYRVAIARTLARLGDAGSIRVLTRTFDEQKPRVREGFVEALGALSGDDVLAPRGNEVFEFLVSRIESDPDDAVKLACAAELQRMTGATIGVDAEAWRAWRADRDLAADIEAGDMSRIVPEARRAARETDLPAFRRALDAMIRVGSDVAFREARGFVMQARLDGRVRQMALDALTTAGQALDREQLLDLLDREDDAAIAQAAIRGLARHDEPRVIDALGERYLIEVNREVRLAIVETLAGMTEDATLRALVPAVRDEVPTIATLAQETLKRRTGEDHGDDTEAWSEWIAKYVK